MYFSTLIVLRFDTLVSRHSHTGIWLHYGFAGKGFLGPSGLKLRFASARGGVSAAECGPLQDAALLCNLLAATVSWKNSMSRGISGSLLRLRSRSESSEGAVGHGRSAWGIGSVARAGGAGVWEAKAIFRSGR